MSGLIDGADEHGQGFLVEGRLPSTSECLVRAETLLQISIKLEAIATRGDQGSGTLLLGRWRLHSRCTARWCGRARSGGLVPGTRIVRREGGLMATINLPRLMAVLGDAWPARPAGRFGLVGHQVLQKLT